MYQILSYVIWSAKQTQEVLLIILISQLRKPRLRATRQYFQDCHCFPRLDLEFGPSVPDATVSTLSECTFKLRRRSTFAILFSEYVNIPKNVNA